MKKKLSLLSALILLIVMPMTAYAQTVTQFDRSKLESSDLYSYDKFKKTWTMQAHWVKKYSDAEVRVHLVIFDSNVKEGETVGPELIVQYFDKETNQYNEVTAFRVLIDDKLYSFEGMQMERADGSSAYGGHVLRNMLSELQNGKEIAFQIAYVNKYKASYTATIDPVDITTIADIKVMGNLLEQSGFWDIIDSTTMSICDTLFSATESN